MKPKRYFILSIITLKHKTNAFLEVNCDKNQSSLHDPLKYPTVRSENYNSHNKKSFQIENYFQTFPLIAAFSLRLKRTRIVWFVNKHWTNKWSLWFINILPNPRLGFVSFVFKHSNDLTGKLGLIKNRFYISFHLPVKY